MKNSEMLRGSSAGLAEIIRMSITNNFLINREHAVGLAPISPACNVGYIWRRVFLRGRRDRA